MPVRRHSGGNDDVSSSRCATPGPLNTTSTASHTCQNTMPCSLPPCCSHTGGSGGAAPRRSCMRPCTPIVVALQKHWGVGTAPDDVDVVVTPVVALQQHWGVGTASDDEDAVATPFLSQSTTQRLCTAPAGVSSFSHYHSVVCTQGVRGAQPPRRSCMRPCPHRCGIAKALGSGHGFRRRGRRRLW